MSIISSFQLRKKKAETLFLLHASYAKIFYFDFPTLLL